MRIVCIGGGAAGLYFGLLMKKENPAHHVTVIERNQPYDTFGWGVVFSDATMERMRAWDSKTAKAIESAFNHWDDIEVLIKDRRMRTTGHGFVGIGRKKLLNILQERCEELGVELVFEREVDFDLEFPDADLIVASDGINSKIRNRYQKEFKPDILVRPNRFIWLGTRSPTTLSPSIFAAPNTAGSKPISTNSTKTPRPSSSRRPRMCSRRTASIPPTKRARSPSARSYSARCSTARA